MSPVRRLPNGVVVTSQPVFDSAEVEAFVGGLITFTFTNNTGVPTTATDGIATIQDPNGFTYKWRMTSDGKDPASFETHLLLKLPGRWKVSVVFLGKSSDGKYTEIKSTFEKYLRAVQRPNK